MSRVDVVIIGAGMAGLAAARTLPPGTSFRVIDKGRGLGGRLATRRAHGAVFDHGAQFFTVRGNAFAGLIERAMSDGAVAEWCRGFEVDDGYPRYRGERGMTSLAKWMASDIDVELATEVARVECTGSAVRCIDADGGVIAEGTDAIMTAPIPQSLRMLDAGQVELPRDLDTTLRSVDYFATLALLAVVGDGSAVAEPGGMQLAEGPFTFIADNHRKGISAVPALTFHADHDYSLRRYDDEPDAVLAELVTLAAPWIAGAELVSAQLKKWRYAGPVTALPNPTEVIRCGTSRIALAGDAFAGPKVEGAFNSGQAAARALI